MDLYKRENRQMLLSCLKDNALNMRQVHHSAINFVGTIEERASFNLANVEQLNAQLTDMKSVVEQLIDTMDESEMGPDYNELDAVDEICEILINAVTGSEARQIDMELDRDLALIEGDASEDENDQD